jgi:hypothetical protein
MLKYLTAYGVDNWNDTELLDALSHFDMVATYDSKNSPAPIRVRYSHDKLKLLAYLDTCVEMQGEGARDFNMASPTYWGYYAIGKFQQFQSATGNAFDGLFLDNTYGNSGADYVNQGSGSGPGPYAQIQDYHNLGAWLTGKYDGTRKVPLVLENGGDPGLADHADLWMAEGFPAGGDKHVIDYLYSVTSQGKGAVTLSRGSGAPDTEAGCTFYLACFLCGATPPGLAYFEYGDIWTGSRGWWPIMDRDYGTPIGPYTLSGSVLTRTYTKCSVSANLSTKVGQITMVDSGTTPTPTPVPTPVPVPVPTPTPIPTPTPTPEPSIVWEGKKASWTAGAALMAEGWEPYAGNATTHFFKRRVK